MKNFLLVTLVSIFVAGCNGSSTTAASTTASSSSSSTPISGIAAPNQVSTVPSN